MLAGVVKKFLSCITFLYPALTYRKAQTKGPVRCNSIKGVTANVNRGRKRGKWANLEDGGALISPIAHDKGSLDSKGSFI